MGVDPKRLGNDTIIRVSRQNSSGTYVYFREAVMGKTRDYKLGSIDQNGSVDVVALVANTPSAIGYSGMGYAVPGVKMLKISKHKGEPGVAPTVENAKKREGGYPITRPLLLYTAGEPEGKAKQLSRLDPGQAGPEGRRGTGIRARRRIMNDQPSTTRRGDEAWPRVDLCHAAGRAGPHANRPSNG